MRVGVRVCVRKSERKILSKNVRMEMRCQRGYFVSPLRLKNGFLRFFLFFAELQKRGKTRVREKATTACSILTTFKRVCE